MEMMESRFVFPRFREFARGLRVWKGMEAHFTGGRCGSGDELFDGLENDFEVLVVLGVFRFEGFDFLGEQGIGVHQAAELDEGAHDRDVHLHGSGRAEHT